MTSIERPSENMHQLTHVPSFPPGFSNSHNVCKKVTSNSYLVQNKCMFDFKCNGELLRQRFTLGRFWEKRLWDRLLSSSYSSVYTGLFLYARNGLNEYVLNGNTGSLMTTGCGLTQDMWISARKSRMSKHREVSTNTNPNKKTKWGEFLWSNDECELILNATHEYKIIQLMNRTDWERVHSKYSDILELFKKEIPEIEEDSRLM